jgi:hypothetical protein
MATQQVGSQRERKREKSERECERQRECERVIEGKKKEGDQKN